MDQNSAGADDTSSLLHRSKLADPVPEEAFDRFTRLAAKLLRVPVAQLNVILNGRQVSKSSVGPEPWPSTRSVPLSHSFCQHVVSSGDPLLVEDAREHPLVRENAATVESGIVAYVGMPLTLPDERALGSLCVVDFEPRAWRDEELRDLGDLALAASTEIRLRLELAQRRDAATVLEERIAERTAELEEERDRLRENEAQLAEAEALARLGSWAYDLKRLRLTWSAQAQRIFGRDTEGFTMQVLLAQIEPEFRDRFRERLERLIEVGEPFSEEFCMAADGPRKYLHARGTAELGPDGSPVRLLGTVQDITERKEAEEALRRTEEQLRQSQKLESMGKVVGEVAHDFNNLLTVIGATSQLAIEDLPVESPLRQDLLDINAAAGRARELTSHLLTFSRRQDVKPRVLDVSAKVQEELPILRRLMGGRVQLAAELDEALPSVIVDEGQLGQVLMNLCVNARDAMPEGGRVTIRTHAVEVEEEEAANHPLKLEAGRFVAISVADTGTGMEPEMITRIFEPFFTTKGVGVGTGLGLSTVYGIVRKHGGRIAVETAPGSGTTMKVLFPPADRARRVGERQGDEGKPVDGRGGSAVQA